MTLDRATLRPVLYVRDTIHRSVPNLRDPILQHCHHYNDQERNLVLVSIQFNRSVKGKVADPYEEQVSIAPDPLDFLCVCYPELLVMLAWCRSRFCLDLVLELPGRQPTGLILIKSLNTLVVKRSLCRSLNRGHHFRVDIASRKSWVDFFVGRRG